MLMKLPFFGLLQFYNTPLKSTVICNCEFINTLPTESQNNTRIKMCRF